MANRCECCGKIIDIDPVATICQDCSGVLDDPALKRAINLLYQTYVKTTKLDYIRNPLAAALYQVWKRFDDRR